MYKLSEEQLSLLENLVKQANGELIVLTHPLFSGKTDSLYMRELEKTLNQTRVPVIILQEHDRLAQLEDYLRTKKANCFIMPTAPASHALIKKGFNDYKQEWLLTLIRKVGAKKVRLGGQHSNHEPEVKGLPVECARPNLVIQHLCSPDLKFTQKN